MTRGTPADDSAGAAKDEDERVPNCQPFARI